MSKSVLRRRLVAAGSVAAAVASAALVASGPAAATPTMTITSINVHRLPALTAKQVITITGTNFDEDSISSVAINGCTAGSYIVSSATTIVFKTDNTCATTSTGVITLTPVSGSNVVTTPGTNTKEALAFVAAPTLADNDGTTFPVVTTNTASQTTPTETASSSGGVSIKVSSGTTAFVNSATYPLSATMDGYALTSVVMHTGGDYFTATLPAIPADATPTLKVTSNGVSKSFSYAAASSSSTVANSFEFTISGVSIKVSPAFGPMDGGNKITVTGSGFTTSTTVTVDSVSCPVVSGSVKPTTLQCTVAAASTAGPVVVATSTGGVTSVTDQGSTYTYIS